MAIAVWAKRGHIVVQQAFLRWVKMNREERNQHKVEDLRENLGLLEQLKERIA